MGVSCSRSIYWLVANKCNVQFRLLSCPACASGTCSYWDIDLRLCASIIGSSATYRPSSSCEVHGTGSCPLLSPSTTTSPPTAARGTTTAFEECSCRRSLRVAHPFVRYMRALVSTPSMQLNEHALLAAERTCACTCTYVHCMCMCMYMCMHMHMHMYM